MFHVNQLSGFGAGGNPPQPFSIRRMGTYPITFAASATGTGSIPAVDLGVAAPNKQLLVFFSHETQVPRTAVIDGVSLSLICLDWFTAALAIFGTDYVGSGPVSLSFTVAGSTSAQGNAEVYEIYGAEPVHKAPRTVGGISGGTAMAAFPVRLIAGDFAIANSLTLLDTTTYTWLGSFSENSDYDAGTHRVSSAQAGPAGGLTDIGIAATLSGADSGSIVAVGIQPLGGRANVKGGFVSLQSIAAVGTTATYAATPTGDLTGLGAGELVCQFFVEADVTITGVTWGGVAMTSRGAVTNAGATPDLHLSTWSIPFTQGAPSGAIVATFSSGAAAGLTIALAKWAFYNIGSWGTAGSATGSAVGAAVNINTNANSVTLGSHIRDTTAKRVTWTNIDEQWDNDSGAYSYSFAVKNDMTASTPVAITAAGAGADQYATLAIPINP